MALVLIGRDLEFYCLEADAVVSTDSSLILLAENIIGAFSHPGDKR